MKKINLSLLDMSDVLVKENKLDCFEKYSMSAGYTDMFSITGGKTNLENMNRIPDEYGLKNRTAPYIFNSLLKNDCVFSVDECGKKSHVSKDDCTVGIRPTAIINDNTVLDDIIKQGKVNKYKVFETEYGEYPQYAASHMVGLALEDEYSNNLNDGEYFGSILIRTGKEYSFIQNGKINTYSEFYYGSNKYIRMIVTCDENGIILSNGNTYYNGDAVWVKVSPVKWFVDFNSKRLLSKFVLLSGLKPNIDLFNYFGNFMDDDIFVDSLTRDEILRMICVSFYKLDYNTQIGLISGITDQIYFFNDLSTSQLMELLNRISMVDYGYSKKLKQYYF